MELLEMPVEEVDAEIEIEPKPVKFDERAFQLWQEASRTEAPPEEA